MIRYQFSKLSHISAVHEHPCDCIKKVPAGTEYHVDFLSRIDEGVAKEDEVKPTFWQRLRPFRPDHYVAQADRWEDEDFLGDVSSMKNEYNHHVNYVNGKWVWRAHATLYFLDKNSVTVYFKDDSQYHKFMARHIDLNAGLGWDLAIDSKTNMLIDIQQINENDDILPAGFGQAHIKTNE